MTLRALKDVIFIQGINAHLALARRTTDSLHYIKMSLC